MPIINNLTTLFSFSEETISMLIARVLVIAFLLPFHELAHGWVANKLGDPTAKWTGRLTLNPVKHIDPFGLILMLFTGIGWAKPVPINPRNFKNMKKGMAITAAAGPIANFLMALGLTILTKLMLLIYTLTGGATWLSVIILVLDGMAWINITLGVFNLIPIPPLDGSRIIGLFLPDKIYYTLMQYEQYILYGFMALLMFTNILSRPISWVSLYIYNFFDWITGFIDLIARML